MSFGHLLGRELTCWSQLTNGNGVVDAVPFELLILFRVLGKSQACKLWPIGSSGGGTRTPDTRIMIPVTPLTYPSNTLRIADSYDRLRRVFTFLWPGNAAAR